MLQKWRNASLRIHVLIQVSLALGVVFVAFLFTSTEALNTSTQSALQERLVLARLMADRMDVQIVHTTQLLQGALSSANLNLADNNLAPEKDLLFSIYKESDLFQRVTLLDETGAVVWLEPYEEGRIGINYTQPPYSSDFLGAQRPVLIAKPSPRTQSASIAIFVPIPGGDGRAVGYLNGWIDLSNPRAQSLFYPFEPGSKGYTDLVDTEGIVLASTQPDRVNQATDHVGVFGDLIGSKQATVGACHSCHAGHDEARQSDVLAFAPLASVPWGLALRQPEDEVLAGTHYLASRLGLLAVVVLAAFASLFWMSTRQIVQPLGALTDACRRIAGGDLEHPVPITGDGETGTLARSFEEMRRELLGYQEQMRQHQRNLELRIQQRTSELVTSRDYLLKTNRNLTALIRVAGTLGHNLGAQGTIGATLDCALDAVSAESGGIALHEPDGSLTLVAQRGLPPDVQAALAQPIAQPADTSDPRSPAELPYQRILASRLNAPSLLFTPLSTHGEALGCLFVADSRPNHFSIEDHNLLAAISWQVAVAVRNTRLYEALQQEERARGKMIRQVIAAQEDERKRIARELHDETSQSLTALMVGLDAARLALTTDTHASEAHLSSTRTIATNMLGNIHRLVADLRPSLLDDLGLLPAISWYGEKLLKPSGIQLSLTGNLMDSRLPSSLEVTLFRIVQEAITNIVRHAHASQAAINLQQTDGHIVLTIKDNGRGFRLAGGSITSDNHGVGLLGIQERAAILGGDCRVQSAQGSGTQIQVTIPYPSVAGQTELAESPMRG